MDNAKDWNPELYLRFKAARFAPVADLLNLTQPKTRGEVIDLGCGTGDATALLAERMKDCSVLGIDSSRAMLERARAHKGTNLRFEHSDIAEVGGQWDTIFSNAAIQWLPDHPALLQGLWTRLRPGGRMAIQVPANHAYFANHLREVVAALEPFREALRGFELQTSVRPLHEYAQILYRLKAHDTIAFEKIYPAILPSSDAVFEWLTSTTLRPYWQHLPDALHKPFADEIRARLRAHYGQGEVFFPYRRILFAGTKAA